MKRFLPLFALVGLCGLAVPLLTASDGEKREWCVRHFPADAKACSGGGAGCPIPLTSEARSPRAIDAQVVQELTTILNETPSRDTFVFTVVVLGKMGRTARPALPAIIRNAERLRLFTTNARGTGDNWATLNDAIDCILERSPTPSVQVTAKVNPPAPSPAASPAPVLPLAPRPARAPVPVTPASHVCRPAPAAPQSAPPPLAVSPAPRLVPMPLR